jgi:RHS repeat-associated protein
LHYLTSIFLTLLFFFTGEDFALAKNQVSSASLGFLCTSASQKEFLTTDRTEYTDKIELDRQGAKNAKVFKPSLEPVFRDSTSIHSFSISASLGDLCALAVNSSSSRLTTDTYDANGNTLVSKEGGTGVSPVSSSPVTDVYSFDNKLIRRTTPDGKTIDLTYSPDGHRLSKFITQNGLTQRLVHYLTDANNPTGYAQVIEEKQPLEATGSQLKKVNLYGHDLIATEERSTGVSPVSSIYYTYDGLGSVRSITDTTADIKETYDYDAYGTLIGLAKRNPTTGLLESSNLSSTIPNPQSDYLYTGEQWDADLGMYFLRARYLNTNTGRFHSQDSYEGRNGEPLTLHKYLYANGNPAMFTDPSGQFVPLWLMGIFVHQKIADHFIAQDRDHRTANRQLRTIINYFTGEYPDGAEGRLSKGNVFLTLPDLIDYRTKEIYEIKPAHLAPQGAIQLAGYVGILNLFGGAGFTFGTSYKPPTSVDLPFGYKAMIIPASVAGLVLYELYNPTLTKMTLGTVAAAATVYVGYNTALAFSGFAEEFATASFLGSRGIL